MKKKILIRLWIVSLIGFVLFGMGVAWRRDSKNSTVEAFEKEQVEEEDIEEEGKKDKDKDIALKNKEWFVIINGANGNAYANTYRKDINKEKKIIEKIIKLEVKDEKLQMTEIPKEMQYFYEEPKVSDELRFLNSYGVNLEKENIISLDNKKYEEFLRKLNIKSANEKRVKEVLEKLKVKENEKYLKELINNDLKEKSILDVVVKINELDMRIEKVKFKEVKKNKIKELFKAEEVLGININAMDKDVIYLDKEVVEKNIYYLGVKEEIKKKESQKQVQENNRNENTRPVINTNKPNSTKPNPSNQDNVNAGATDDNDNEETEDKDKPEKPSEEENIEKPNGENNKPEKPSENNNETSEIN